jgi:putative flavoprotein involved in K+ transport
VGGGATSRWCSGPRPTSCGPTADGARRSARSIPRRRCGGITTDKADLIFASIPYKILPAFQKPLYDTMKERDADFYAGLEKAGFMARLGRRRLGPVHEVPAPRLGLLHRRRRLQLIIDGKIKLKRAGEEITEDAVVLEDGTELPPT